MNMDDNDDDECDDAGPVGLLGTMDDSKERGTLITRSSSIGGVMLIHE